MLKLLPMSVLMFFAKEVWIRVVYPLLDKFVKSTPNIYDDKGLDLLNQAVLFVCSNLGVSQPAKLSK